MDYFLNSQDSLNEEDQDGFSWKTSQDYSIVKTGKISELSSELWMNSGMVWHGEYWTQNSLERPKDAVGYSLSQVIDQQAPLKYFLTRSQLQSLLERAKARSKTIALALETAIQKQISILSNMPQLEEMIKQDRKLKDTEMMERLGLSTLEEVPMLYVRRMTPSEYERLQGFPDGWTEVPEARLTASKKMPKARSNKQVTHPKKTKTRKKEEKEMIATDTDAREMPLLFP